MFALEKIQPCSPIVDSLKRLGTIRVDPKLGEDLILPEVWELISHLERRRESEIVQREYIVQRMTYESEN